MYLILAELSTISGCVRVTNVLPALPGHQQGRRKTEQAEFHQSTLDPRDVDRRVSSGRLFTLTQTQFGHAGLPQYIKGVQKWPLKEGEVLQTHISPAGFRAVTVQRREEPSPAAFSKVSRKSSEKLRCPCQNVQNQSPASVFISAKWIYLGNSLHAAS